MSTSHSIDMAGVLRRLVHVVILVVVIVGVRACGGAASTEDQLGAGTQWFAERTGLAAAKEKWDKSIRPPIAALTTSTSEAFYRRISRTMENGAVASDRAQEWISDATRKTAEAVTGVMRSLFSSGAEPSTSPTQQSSPTEEQPRSQSTP